MIFNIGICSLGCDLWDVILDTDLALNKQWAII